MHKTFRYQLYPSKPQQRLLERTLETCRRWYNQCLAERRDAYQERRERITKFRQLAQVKDIKRTNPYAAPVHSHILQVVVTDLDTAFPAFFRRVKAGEIPGYPRFKGRNRFSSFGLKEYGNGFRIDGRRLKLSGIGRVAVRWHRPLEGKVKTLRIVRTAGKWYAAFSCDIEGPSPSHPHPGSAVGIDVGIRHLATTSDGEQIVAPRWYRDAQARLRVVQRQVARRKRGGCNRAKSVLRLQRLHEQVANQRKDFLNKLAHTMSRRYAVIALEDLRITGMVKNRRLAKSILDAGWGYLVTRLERKAAEAGGRVVLVNPRNTSKMCSQCGAIFEGLTLAERWVVCGCGVSLDRDHNAARNILERAGHVRWAVSSSMDGFAQEAAAL